MQQELQAAGASGEAAAAAAAAAPAADAPAVVAHTGFSAAGGWHLDGEHSHSCWGCLLRQFLAAGVHVYAMYASASAAACRFAQQGARL